MKLELDNLVKIIRETVRTHELETPGEYARWIWNDEEGSRNLGSSEYGCADAANILYIIGDFERDPEQRAAAVKALQVLQDPETGLFREPTHHNLHTTAHCVAALELFDAAPAHPLKALEKYMTKEGLYDLLENLDWKGQPWPQSHQGAGVFAAATVAGMADAQWQDWYFDWLWNEADPETGMWRKGCMGEGSAPLYHHMGGTFHYIFNHEAARRPLRYPEKLIDTMIELYKTGKIDHLEPEYGFGHRVGFLEIDWVFTLTRASRQTPHRFYEVKEILRDFAEKYVAWLYSLDHAHHDGFNDLHMLFGAVCCLAELQTALPGELRTTKPLKIVLDRRPFI